MKDKMKPSVHGVGYLGYGKYGTDHPAYNVWRSMIRRGYDLKLKDKFKTYIDCTVCDEWHCYQNFAEWYDSEYVDIGMGLDLDKDILLAGNKHYSPETCCLVPRSINTFIIGCDSRRGDTPIGVHYEKLRIGRNKYKANCNNPITRKVENIGYFRTAEEAHQAFLKRKTQHLEGYYDLIKSLKSGDRIYLALKERYKFKQ